MMLPTEATDHGLQGLFAVRSATCEWPRYWLDAHARNDADAQARSQAALDAAPIWPWITATDGGGVADGLRQLADDLRSGDTAPGTAGVPRAGTTVTRSLPAS